MKQLTILFIAFLLVNTTASAQFFHRKGDKAQPTTTETKKVHERKSKVKVKEEASPAPVVAAPAEPVPNPIVKRKGDPTLFGTDWYLIDVSGKQLNSQPGEKAIFLRLNPKHRMLEGNTGCNSVGGNYETQKHFAIKFTPVSTKMACTSSHNESYMLSSLQQANRYDLNGNNLLLYNDNMLLAIFEAR